MTRNQYELNPKECKYCKIPIIFEKRVNTFCSSSCSCTYNNLGSTKSEKTKKLISTTLKSRIDYSVFDLNRCINCSIEFLVQGKSRYLKCCSKECCSVINKVNMTERMKRRKELGLHVGWVSRNTLSYPEKFFISVLRNNKIFSKCKTNFPKGGYFLDFYFPEIQLDLEIDGGQHEWPERKVSDIKRDSYLESQGIIVHRIPWRSINKQEGKDYIEEEIKLFLDLYNKLK